MTCYSFYYRTKTRTLHRVSEEHSPEEAFQWSYGFWPEEEDIVFEPVFGCCEPDA